MTISADFDTIWTEKKAVDNTVEVKALMQNCMNVIQETIARVDALLAAKSDTGAKSVDEALAKALLALKTVQGDLSDKDVQEVLNWAGKQ